MRGKKGPWKGVVLGMNVALQILQKKRLVLKASGKTFFLVGLLVLASVLVFYPIPVTASISTLTIRPNAAGTFSRWVPVGDSPNYKCVDEEIRDGDVTYVRDTVGKRSDSYNLQDHTTQTGNISNVRAVAWAYDAAGPENLHLTVVIGGMQYLGAKQILTGSYAQYTENWAQNPATGANWTWSNIDALEAGIYTIPTGKWTGDVHVTQLYVEVTYTVAHDVAIISVAPSPTKVNPGQLVNITVVAENQGSATETFNVTAYYDNTPIGKKTVSGLAAGARTSINFSWSTTGTAEGKYVVKAIADAVPGEVDIADNNYVDGTVTIITPTVSIYPASIIVPPPNITQAFDINITISDVVNLYSWQAGLVFNPNVLEALSFMEGPFLRQGGRTIFINGTIDNMAGVITYYACSLTGNVLGVTGNGTLGIITFRVKYYGNSTLHLADVILLDSTSTETPRNLVDGEVYVKIPGDVNGDGIVDASDLFYLGKAYGSDQSMSNWNPDCDFNGDYKVDASDLLDLNKNYPLFLDLNVDTTATETSVIIETGKADELI